MRFVCSLVEDRGVAPPTAAKYFSETQGWHAREWGVKLAGGLKMERLPQMLKGLRRIVGDKPKIIRIPISPDKLQMAMDKLLDPNNPRHANLRTAIAVAFQGLLRSAEYIGGAMLRDDIDTLTLAMLVIMMHPCKNMIHLTGKTCPLVLGAGGKFIDAVKEVHNLLRVDPARGQSNVPFFREPATNKPISYDTMNNLMKEIYGHAGLDPSKSGTHVLRISGATALFAGGGSDTIVRTMGRWSSDVYRLYVRACFDQCCTWSAKAGSTSFLATAAVYDEVDEY